MTEHQQAPFTLLRSQRIDALHITVEEYRHTATGAQHIHLAADNSENVFLVALRTVPQNSTGVAHILEHTALCGSKKYPVRDPFFMMTRRSLNTFMNAFTSSDWTAYPFASQNRKDFNNLLDVYLDAVFFANLDPLDFAQEGHRVEFTERDNPTSDLVFKGVVFNEMKGAMSSTPSQLWQKLTSHLFPSTTYHYNSGGDPEHIVDLSYDDLVAFYRHHYHPSNAIFMTYGDIPAAEHQQKFETSVLSQFGRLDTGIQVLPEKRLHAPIRVEDAYPLDGDDNHEQKTHVALGWLLGEVTDLKSGLESHLMTMVLLNNSASPLLKALETSDLGLSPSPLCGLEDSQFEMSFVCGLEGCRADAAPAVEQLIMDILKEVARDGIAFEDVEAALHQLELSQREVGGDGYPFGLQLILTALTAATHRGDPIGLLDVETALADLRAQIQDPNFIPDLVRSRLIDNPHRVTLTLRPDANMAGNMLAAEQAQLAARKAGLDNAASARIIAQAQALEARQQQQDDEAILPCVTLADIPAQMHYIPGTHETIGDYPLRCYSAGTNGLMYQQLVLSLPELTDAELRLLPLYCSCLTELGCKDEDYLAVQSRQAKTVGGISARFSLRGTGDDPQVTRGYLTLATKALAINARAASTLLQDTLQYTRFDELERLHELISQMRSRREQSITGSGHSLAMTAASAGISPAARLNHQLGGLEGIRQIMQLDDSLTDSDTLAQFSQDLSALHQRLLQTPRQFLLVGEDEQLDSYRADLTSLWPKAPDAPFSPLNLAPVSAQVREGWIASTQVNFCAKAYPTVAGDHPDAAALTVLGGVLRNGFLHRVIREQGGAYGGGASQDNSNGAFRFYSYRDPRLADTLADFDHSIVWLIENPPATRAIEESILGVISSLDKPGSPAGEAQQTFQAELFDRTRDKREHFRERVLAVTAADLIRVAKTYLQPDKASIAVVTGPTQRQILSDLGLTIKTLRQGA